jgi:DNA (cytosine-5)-methyltransferase 1
MSKLRVLDLFSGIGGFSLGLERTGGFETVAFCEIEDYPRRVLEKHWPGVPIYEDVRTLTADTLRRDGIAVDVICGGFPCQDISVANVKGIGLAGERSGLWREYARLVRVLGPRFVFVENVAALLGRGAGDVLGDLAACGFDAEWFALPASAIGAPHHRDRLWIVAYPCGTGREGHQSILGIFESEAAASAKHGNPFAGAWRALGGGFSDLRPGDGVSVGMERRKLRTTGNAVVPQIPELIGRAILKAEGLA